MIRIAVAIAFGLSLSSPIPCRGAAGDFDPTFADGRGISTAIGEYAFVDALARQPDGKLLAAGHAAETDHAAPDITVVRYLPDGAIDTTFGNGGITRTSLGTAAPVPVAILVQSSGKIVVVARYNSGARDRVALLRYDAAGHLDSGFGVGGIVVTVLGITEEPAAATLDDADGIVVVGDTSMLGGPQSGEVLVLHYDAAGVLDPAFGTDGVARVHFGGARDDARAMVREPDGHVVVAGFTWVDASDREAGTSVALARLDATGGLDASFGNGGIVVQPVRHEEQPSGMVRLADGRLVVMGTSFDPLVGGLKGGPRFLLRFDAAGHLDTGFGVHGVAWPEFAPALPTLLPAADDRVVAVGYATETLFNYGMAIARYDANGSLDPTFADAGRIVSTVGAFTSLAQTGLALPDGRIIAAGYDSLPAPDEPGEVWYHFGIARILSADAPCASDADCGACESCGATGTCVLGPRHGCAPARPHAGKLLLYKPEPEVARYRFSFGWHGTAPAGFDPSTTDAGVCLYAVGRRYLRMIAPANGSCGGKPCWRAKPTNAAYRDRDETRDGIETLKLSPTAVSLNAGGVRLGGAMHGMPDPGLLNGRLPLVVQTHLGGRCREATFSSSLPVILKQARLVGVRGISD